MKTDRLYYSAAGLLFLLLTFIGFFAFYTEGRAFGGGEITPAIRGHVVVHGLAVTGWYVLFCAQAFLIATRNRSIHKKLGWTSLGVAPLIVVTGLVTAVLSVQQSPDFVFFGMRYPDFLLVMLAELTAFAAFVTAGLLTRVRPAVHRPMMLLASLSLILGATVRIPALTDLFGGSQSPMAVVGPLPVLVALLAGVRFLMTRTLDRTFAWGSAAMVIFYFAAVFVCGTVLWQSVANMIVGR